MTDASSVFSPTGLAVGMWMQEEALVPICVSGDPVPFLLGPPEAHPVTHRRAGWISPVTVRWGGGCPLLSAPRWGRGFSCHRSLHGSQGSRWGWEDTGRCGRVPDPTPRMQARSQVAAWPLSAQTWGVGRGLREGWRTWAGCALAGGAACPSVPWGPGSSLYFLLRSLFACGV